MAEVTFRDFILDLKDCAKETLEDNQDWFFLVGGSEGAGKSTFVYLTIKELKKELKDLCKLRCFFIKDHKHLIKIIESLACEVEACIGQKYKYNRINILWYDEAIVSTDSRESMSSENRITRKIITQCRQIHGFNFWIQPNLFWFDKDIREWRNNMYIHIIRKRDEEGNLKRYAFVFYKSNVIERLKLGDKYFEVGICASKIEYLIKKCTYWFEIPYVKEEELYEYSKLKINNFLERLKEYKERLGIEFNPKATLKVKYILWQEVLDKEDLIREGKV